MFLVHHHYPIWCRLQWHNPKQSKEVERSREIKGDTSCHLPQASLTHCLLSLLGISFPMEFQRNETKSIWLELSDKAGFEKNWISPQKTPTSSAKLTSKPSALETVIMICRMYSQSRAFLIIHFWQYSSRHSLSCSSLWYQLELF